MVDQPQTPGPGEHSGPEHIQAEASIGPIPDGEMPGIEPYQDQRRRTLEMQPVEASAENEREGVLRRTGTEQDDLRPVAVTGSATEHRQDSSATDTYRETTFDPAQDDVGPHSDQA